jgi:two-component system sensor histidine kinase VanS
LNNDTTSRLRRSRLSRQILIQYAAVLAVFAVVSVFLFLFAYSLYSSFPFKGTDLVYILAQFYASYKIPFNAIILFTGWVIITYYFISKPLHYLDEVVNAAGQLAQSSDEPVKLSDALKGTQDELNLVREKALRSAIAAKEAEQRKNDLVVYLAHDLKTPLTSIIGYLTLLRDEPQISQELRARYTGIAMDKSERLENLINEFFEITRFNLTTLTLEPECTNFSRMLEQLADEFNPILAEKELRWHTEIAPDVEIFCDPDKLERVFDNLIRNAVNYSYSQKELFLSLAKIGNQVEVVVKNRGKTIPPDKLERIFDQFFRLDSSRSSATGGAGLGLAISKEIVELHNGSIKAESAEESIAFRVLLPVDCQKIERIS